MTLLPTLPYLSPSKFNLGILNDIDAVLHLILLALGGGGIPTRTVVTHAMSPYSMNPATDYLMGCMSNTGTISLRLPSLLTVAPLKIYIAKDEGGMAYTNNIELVPFPGEMIDGSTSPVVIASNYGYTRIYATAGGWFTF